MKKLFLLLTLSLFILSCGAGEMIKLGTQAKALDVKSWATGEPVTVAEYKDKKIVVIFFWGIDNESLMAFQPLAELCKKVDASKVAWIGVAIGDEKKIKEFKLTRMLPFPVAVDKGGCAKAYLPEKIKYPACAIIAKDGRLAWRGSVRNMPVVLKTLMAGKFNLDEVARKEDFNIKLGKAMKEKKTAEALLLVEAEQKRKFSPEMVSLHLQLLLEAKDTNGATAMLDKVISAHPQYIGPHLLRQMLHRSYFKNEAKATAYANDTIEKLKSHPAVLSDFVQNEIKLPPGQGDPDLIYRAAVALKKAVTKLKGREKAVPLLIYAQAMNICGFNDRAAAAAAEAEKEFEKPQEKQSVEQIRKHFSKLDEVNKRYSSDK